MRIGIFGGTFDPPHVGHLLAASDAMEALGLDRVVFVPAAEQPLKGGVTLASARDRLAMVSLAVGRDDRFSVDAIEVERGGLSYTVDTLRALHGRWRDNRELSLFLLLGEDVAATLPKWREPDAVAALAEIVVLTRTSRGAEQSEGAGGPYSRGARILPTRRVDISSTEIRARVAGGKSIHGFVPDAVLQFVAERRLYR